MPDKPPCHDCGCEEGSLHLGGCDMERCPFCGGQSITCDCCYRHLGFHVDESLPFAGLPEEIYNAGLTEDMNRRWNAILETKGRIPFIRYPNICCKCGGLWPDMFHVPDEEWEKYVEPCMRRKMLCRTCYDEIKAYQLTPRKL